MNNKRHLMNVLNGLCFILWLIALSYLGLMYHKIPDQVGTHFTLLGHADAFGNKANLWLLPVVFVLIWKVGVLLIYKLPTLRNILSDDKQPVVTHQFIITGLFSIIHVTVWMLYMNQLHHLLHGEHNITAIFTLLPIVSLCIYSIILISYGFKKRRKKRHRN
ncbi:DUF1648 domain-containing protein [Staphylococcus agnetis]|uniref:DUF1648 domain-containing protein n=1 Tax=Staphylococcus agnetis TaxID=985762 RepID=A0ABD7TTH9_9STAP|nr:DUF1648 domain-containing protein [Staphylococcus agnetis]UXU57576.1 DUF1648 domain-containing protein [Staphylococcus agnetis]